MLNSKEASAFLAAYNGASSSELSRGTTELFEVIKKRETVLPVLQRSSILETTLNTRQVRVSALSPVPAAFAQSITNFAQYAAKKDEAINHAPELSPNIEAVVLHVEVGDDAVLLGADLEESQGLGWSAVVADKWSTGRKAATAYKVAHHGSFTGDCNQIWTALLKPDPVAFLTPFTLGSCRLPTDTDKARLKENTPHAYISSGASRKPDIDSRQLKRLRDICKKIAQVDTGFGAVRLRKRIGKKLWQIKLFGVAQHI